MADDDDFLDAIRGAPDDDDLRLVYADWLEERGDPRHLYLRLMVRVAVAERAGRVNEARLGRLDAVAGPIDLEWREAVGIRYEVVLRWVEPSQQSRVCLTLAVMRGRSFNEAVATVGRLPAVVATLIREEAGRFVNHLEAGHYTTRRPPPPPRRGTVRSPLCRVDLRRARSKADEARLPSHPPGRLPYHGR